MRIVTCIDPFEDCHLCSSPGLAGLLPHKPGLDRFEAHLGGCVGAAIALATHEELEAVLVQKLLDVYKKIGTHLTAREAMIPWDLKQFWEKSASCFGEASDAQFHKVSNPLTHIPNPSASIFVNMHHASMEMT